jgi:cathepsin D
LTLLLAPSLTLGGVDTAATAGDLNYVSLVDSGSYWQVPLDGVKVNGVDIGVSASSVIIDR